MMTPRRLATFIEKEFLPLLDDTIAQLENISNDAAPMKEFRKTLAGLYPTLRKSGALQEPLYIAVSETLDRMRGPLAKALAPLSPFFQQRFVAAYQKLQ